MELDFLWLDVDAPAIAPPTVTREQVLPLGSLSWENFERLCFRLAHRRGDVENARMYGERGQAQEGIDLYVRRTTGDYETWQCKRYQHITATDIEKAVTKFLNGDWAGRTKLFRLAVSPSLNATQLAEEIERQRVLCEAANIIFEPLDRDHLSLMLKDHPDLVDDFFGRSWVEAFNGPEAVVSLRGRTLSREQRLTARRFILTLYATHFQTVDGGIPAAAPVFRGAVPRVPVFNRYVEPVIELIESVIEQGQARSVQSESNTQDTVHKIPVTGFRRRETRTKIPLSAGLANCDRFLLLGGAGFGKSAALRVIVHSLLSDDVRFPTLARQWGQRLPLLLPFGFLTRHFAENDIPTIESALKGWLKVLGATDEVLALLEEMLEDERLLLFVDGLDEWQNREAAVTALTALTSYAYSRRLPLLATARPLGFERISDFGPDWKQANLLPLTSVQQQEFATHWFRHFHKVEGSQERVASEQAVTRDVKEFAHDLFEDPTLSELGGVPLLLSVMIYLRLTGRVLPHSRIAALGELVKAFLEDQPRRRAQAAMQRVDQSASRSRWIRHGIEYLAYRIHQEPGSVVIPNDRAAALLNDYFRIGLEMSASEAEGLSARVLDLGQHEFGVLVAPQEHHVGLMHRIFQEYLAARYLARLPLDQVKDYCTNTGRKSPWHEVTLNLMQLLERQDDVDGLIDKLAMPVAECLDEPLQKILLTRVVVAQTNCSRKKAYELLSQVFSWIECGRWMPLRRTLVREVAVGLESELIRSPLAARAARWFPGRVEWLHGIPEAAAKHPTTETVNDLRIALHNCSSDHEYRSIAEALASFAEGFPNLANEFIEILRGPAEPELMGAALYALATGWPDHAALPLVLQLASASEAKDLRQVAILARYNRGDHSDEIRNALEGFCREGEWLWPWEDEIMGALVARWPHNPHLMKGALERANGIQHSASWASKPAIVYLLRACPGDHSVVQMIADRMGQEGWKFHELDISHNHEALLAGFAKHPLLVAAAEAWLDRHAKFSYSPLEVSVIARLGGTLKCRDALLNCLRQGNSGSAWITSALLETWGRDDPEIQAVLAPYILDERQRSQALRLQPEIGTDSKELGVILRDRLLNNDVFDSCYALKALVEKEGRDTPDLWPLVESRLVNDPDNHYWKFGHRTLLKIWPEHALIRQFAKTNVYGEDISMPALFEAYSTDPDIRPLLDSTMQVLHEDLRLEFARAIEPLVRRCVSPAVTIASGFTNEPNGETRTVAARAYARACIRSEGGVQKMIELLSSDLTRPPDREQAAVAAMLELGRADLLGRPREDGRPLEFSTHARWGQNWEFIEAVVEHWEQLVDAIPDVWERFGHSPIIATELARVGKGVLALGQTQRFESEVRTGKQLQAEQVQALITLHGSGAYLRELFLSRLQFMAEQKSMMDIERGAYAAMASYLAENFKADKAVGQVILSIANSGSLISDVGFIALCQGWPEAQPISAVTERLPALIIEGPEPVTAWLFATKADAQLMARYLSSYPNKLYRDHYWDSRNGIDAIRSRLQSDQECRNLVFSDLQNATELNTRVALAKLLAPSMRNVPEFRTWISDQLRIAREDSSVVGQLAFDVIANLHRPLEFALLEPTLTQ